MTEAKKIDLIRYEFITHIKVTDSLAKYIVSDVLLTEDNLTEKTSQCDEINWVTVGNVDLIDIEDLEDDSVVNSQRRICGLFDAEPRDWKYSKIKISDHTNTGCFSALAKMPRSPIVPVVFDVNL